VRGKRSPAAAGGSASSSEVAAAAARVLGAARVDERGAGAAGPFKGVPGILGERARLIRGGDHGGTGAAVAWSRGRGGEGDAGSWARTVSGSRVARARQAGRGGNWADVRRVRPEWSGRAAGVREGTG